MITLLCDSGVAPDAAVDYVRDLWSNGFRRPRVDPCVWMKSTRSWTLPSSS